MHDRVCRDEPFSGVVLVSDDQGDVFVGCCGYANRSWKVPNRRDTRFRVASVGKMHTAVAVLQLVEQGRLSLDAAIVELLSLENSRISAKVTIRHLLTMTSGIADWIDESPTSRWNWDALKRRHPLYLLKESSDYLPLFANREPKFAPGEGWAYCNANFVLLGMAIEKVSGVPYAEYMRQNIFGPYGMTDTDFLPTDSAADRVAEGYVPILDDNRSLVGWKSNVYDLTIEGGADGGSTSTTDDLIRFSRFLGRGNIMGAGLLQDMIALKVEMPFSPRLGCRWWYGCGVEIVSDMEGRIIRWGHGGEEAGVSCRLHHYPNLGLDVAIMGNATECAGPLGIRIGEILAERQF
ncbi:MAG: serine hydrolase [Dehalococcoidia bacterium]|nr:serine hydrolase [Dehalococcoidia bacterium]